MGGWRSHEEGSSSSASTVEVAHNPAQILCCKINKGVSGKSRAVTVQDRFRRNKNSVEAVTRGEAESRLLTAKELLVRVVSPPSASSADQGRCRRLPC